MSLLLQSVRIIKILVILLFAVVALLALYGTSTRWEIHELCHAWAYGQYGEPQLAFELCGRGEQAVVLDSGGGS